MYAAIIGSFFRHALTSVGGALVAKGILQAAMLEPTIGAIMTLAGVVLSIINKKRNAE